MNTETNVNAATSNATSNLLTISSTVPTQPDAGKFLIIARWKNGKNPDGSTKLVSDSNRARSIQLPTGIWANMIETDNQQFVLFIKEAVEELAKQYLAKICEDSNMMRTQVPIESFSLANLLQWNSEQAAISGRLNGEEIKNWLASSETIKAVTIAHSAAIATALGAQFVKLASPNHGLTPAKAESLLTKLFVPADADTTTGLRVMLRLQAIRDRSESTEANVLDSIL